MVIIIMYPLLQAIMRVHEGMVGRDGRGAGVQAVGWRFLIDFDEVDLLVAGCCNNKLVSMHL